MRAFVDRDLRVFVVWMPMLPSDDQRSARIEAARLTDPRVRHFYDGDRLAGRAVTMDLFQNFVRDALASLREDHFVAASLCQAARTPPEKLPMWDIALFYGPRVEWSDRVPRTGGWSKQVAFYGTSRDDGISGLFWADSFKAPPGESDWFDELSRQWAELLKATQPARKAY